MNFRQKKVRQEPFCKIISFPMAAALVRHRQLAPTQVCMSFQLELWLLRLRRASGTELGTSRPPKNTRFQEKLHLNAEFCEMLENLTSTVLCRYRYRTMEAG